MTHKNSFLYLLIVLLCCPLHAQMLRSEKGRLVIHGEFAASAAQQQHIISRGETLWDLADHYLENPFTWPQIWQLNPYIDDPHWIYPGNPLIIPGTNIEAYPAAPPPDRQQMGLHVQRLTLSADSTTAAQDIDTNSTEPKKAHGEWLKLLAAFDSPVITSDIIRRAPFYYEKTDARGVALPGNARISDKNRNGFHPLFSTVELQLFGPLSWEIDDTLDIFRTLQKDKIGGKKRYLVQRIGQLLVTSKGTQTATATVIAVWGEIANGCRVDRTQPIEAVNLTQLSPTPPVSVGRVHHIVYSGATAPLPFTNIIASSAGASIAPATVVQFSSGDKAANVHGHGIVVHSNTTAATILLLGLYDNELQRGNTIQRIAQFQPTY